MVVAKDVKVDNFCSDLERSARESGNSCTPLLPQQVNMAESGVHIPVTSTCHHVHLLG